MIALAAVALLTAQADDVRDWSHLSPPEAALLIQNYLAYGMMETYAEGGAIEGRYISVLENSLTVYRRGVREPLNEEASGWFAHSRHIHRFDIAPVDVELNAERSSLILNISCLEPDYPCIGASSSTPVRRGPTEERGSNVWSIEFTVIEPYPAYAAELEQLFEIWRTAPTPD